MNVLSQCKITKVKARTTAGTSAITTTPVDMQGYESVTFFTVIDTPAANNQMVGVQDTDVALGAVADLAGTAVGDASNGAVVLEIVKPKERYVAAKVNRGTSTAVGEIWAVQTGPRTVPPTNTVAATQLSKSVTSPDEGTP